MLKPEEWKTLKASYWNGVCEEIEVYIKDREMRLRNCNADDLKTNQEAIKALELLKRLPDNALERMS